MIFLSAAQAQERLSKTINSNWHFIKGDTTKTNLTNKWQPVSIPHSWNAVDVMDDQPGYYRGAGWYKKTLYIPSSWKEKEVFIFFEGAAQVAEVFLNGTKIGEHTGSYNFFSFPISKYLKFTKEGNTTNELVVRVDNSNNENIPPLSGDFTFFGGIYRDVYLKAVNKIHFDADNHASSGIFITTPVVNSSTADVHIKGAFLNAGSDKKKLNINHKIVDGNGKLLVEIKNTYHANPGQKVPFSQDMKNIKGFQLWSIENPHLYRLVSTISDAGTNQTLDEVSNPLGFRWFKFDAEKGFFLNGKSVKLVGASRHQDYKGMANALPDALHTRDVELLKAMGGNFLRVSHYPQDPAVLEACDRLGILASVETPIVNRITETAAFAKNSKDMHLEMIRQHFNHPSLIMWTYMNEVLLRPRYEKGSEKQELYFNNITKLAQELEDITRKEDPYRYTMIPNHGAFELYNKVQLTKIPMLVGWNLYLGWYSRTLDGFGAFLDQHRKQLPDKPLLVTEYGADADNRLHSFDPIRFDKTVEYTNKYHQVYLKAMMDRPFVAAAMIWNLAEFNSEARGESTPHINSKGILTHDRKPKDGYRFYQANLLGSPYVQIGSKEWIVRTGFAATEKNAICTQPVIVFSNQKTVSLKQNGKLIGSAATAQGIASFEVPFVNGLNRLTVAAMADGIEINDQVDINFHMLSQNLKSKELPFNELNISLGDKRFFYDENAAQVWISEQEYLPGSWGYKGGSVYTMENTSRLSYGSDKNILGTDLDPIYATQRTGIEQFKFDVPDGDYLVTLHFAELNSAIKREGLIYNLSEGKEGTEEFKERLFDVTINGKEALSGLSNAETLIPEHAVAAKFNISVNNNNGITIDFKAIKGASILNGIQLKKVR
ncbi:glycoside hydrolase family 2 TIM barrel-domain containing protein [Pedobacter immunditicola]|uniref:glycoside hydrolase family 2 TIM barrel-domain containing protein n=1 Tax=Pedobacter immunditicola TaxID=3133440 RepID=UPI0030B3A6A5